jgi:hypothetical protein
MLKPTTVLLEFLTWFAWLACFASLQNMLCVRYPDLRRVCRKAYVCTMMVPILGSLWLMASSDNGTDMFALLNHGFGAGVFAQTFLRAVVLLKWLMASGLPHHVALPDDAGARALYAEGDLVALMGVLGQTLRKPVASERNIAITRERRIAE